jgi:hypothetical protein
LRTRLQGEDPLLHPGHLPPWHKPPTAMLLLTLVAEPGWLHPLSWLKKCPPFARHGRNSIYQRGRPSYSTLRLQKRWTTRTAATVTNRKLQLAPPRGAAVRTESFGLLVRETSLHLNRNRLRLQGRFKQGAGPSTPQGATTVAQRRKTSRRRRPKRSRQQSRPLPRRFVLPSMILHKRPSLRVLVHR